MVREYVWHTYSYPNIIYIYKKVNKYVEKGRNICPENAMIKATDIITW